MVISIESYPNLFKKLYINEKNLECLVNNCAEFNNAMNEKHSIRFALVVLPNKIIIDDKCLDEFDEFLEVHGIK